MLLQTLARDGVSSQVQTPLVDGLEFLEDSVKCIVFMPEL